MIGHLAGPTLGATHRCSGSLPLTTLLGMLLWGVLLPAPHASAHSLTPKCTPDASGYKQVSLQFAADGWGDTEIGTAPGWKQPGGMPWIYGNYAYTPRYLLANRLANHLSLLPSVFSLDSADSVKVGQWNGTLTSYTGTGPGVGNWLTVVGGGAGSASIQNTPGYLRFETSATTGARGFRFTHARVRCESASGTAP